MGAIRAMILIVLGEAKQPLPVREVHAAVEERLGVVVSYETVKNALYLARRNPATGVERVRWGVYHAALAPSSSDPRSGRVTRL
jgi:hypothetical protein